MKSGFAVIIGRSNVGKSTLINSLVGTKVAITTPKPQTTRHPVQGVVTTDEGQIVFVDTPGIMQKAGDQLTKKLNESAKQSLKDIEVVLYVADATRSIGNEERQTLQLIKDIKQPKLLVINKMDDYKSKNYVDYYRDLMQTHNFDAVVEVSAKTRSNLDLVTKWIFEHLPEGEPMYPVGQISNVSPEEQLSEIIREKLFLRLREEVPYSTTVKVEEIEERKNGTLYIKATIYTTDDRYQGMIIGKGGRGIKEIGEAARKEITSVAGQNVFLDLHVEVDARWIERFK
jgi:GTP-binding protein Era